MKEDIYRIFECQNGVLFQLAFVIQQSVQDYLESCYKYNSNQNTFYFAQKIKIEK